MSSRLTHPTLCLAILLAAPLRAIEPALPPPPDQRIDVLQLSVVEMLARIAETGQSMFNNERRVTALEDELRRATDLRQKVGIGFTLAEELLALGRTEQAIDLLLEIRSVFEQPGSNVHPDLLRQLGDRLAVAYLRLGEQQNCINFHTSASCLLPISPEGRHRLQLGSRNAKAELEALLRTKPNLGHRWLLNLAAMTLGEYPDGLPTELRIPPETFDSEYPLPRFRDVAGSTGTDVFGTSGGSVMEDLDGDGRLDLVVSGWGIKEQLRFLHNRGDGTFEDRTETAGILGEFGGLNLTHADYDNDGDADVLVLRGAWLGPDGAYPDSLLQNQGNGTFKNVTREAGLLSFFPNQAGAFADYDLDGHLDLFVGNESMPGVDSPCQLFHNNGDGTFTNVATQVGLDVKGFVKGAAWGDVDNDGRPDLYLSRIGELNQLFHNDGPSPDGSWRFTDITAEVGVAEPKMSFPTWFWDYDNDGWEDLLVAPYSGLFGNSLAAVVADYLGEPSTLEHGRLYRNEGTGPGGEPRFRDVTREMRFDRALLAMGSNFGDLDNDGWLDAYFGTGEPRLETLVPNRMFRNDAGRVFQDVTTAGGFGHLQKGHAVSFGDLDDDGDEDVYAVMGGAYMGDAYRNVLFENPGNANRWVTLVLEGTKSNRAALGARVRIVARTPAGERSIWRTVGTGGSFGSSSLRQEVGLGDATAIIRVEVRWPETRQTLEVFTGMKPGGFYRLREGSKRAERLERSKIRLRRPGEEPAHQQH